MKFELILVYFLLLIGFQLSGQEASYIEFSEIKYKLDSVIIDNNQLGSYKLNKTQFEKVPVPTFYEDAEVRSKSGEFIKYFDHIRNDSIAIDKDLGVVELNDSESFSCFKVNITIDNKTCFIDRMKLYLY